MEFYECKYSKRGDFSQPKAAEPGLGVYGLGGDPSRNSCRVNPEFKPCQEYADDNHYFQVTAFRQDPHVGIRKGPPSKVFTYDPKFGSPFYKCDRPTPSDSTVIGKTFKLLEHFHIADTVVGWPKPSKPGCKTILFPQDGPYLNAKLKAQGKDTLEYDRDQGVNREICATSFPVKIWAELKDTIPRQDTIRSQIITYNLHRVNISKDTLSIFPPTTRISAPRNKTNQSIPTNRRRLDGRKVSKPRH